MSQSRPRQGAVRRGRGSSSRRGRQSTGGFLALILYALLIGLGGIGAIAVVGVYASSTTGLYDPGALERIEFAEESVVYDRTGQVELARFGEFQREVVTFDQLPSALIDATTAVEDKSFWTNPGFDPAAIVSSGIDAIRGNARGGSTITQQLVRQRLLDPELVQSKGRTFERKLKEIVQSIRLTNAFPGEKGKQRIITAYLNQNFYGNNSYGVKAAANNYFNKELDELTLAEAAIIAALPQSPSNYDLVRNAVVATDGSLVVPPDSDIVQRRNRVLELMAAGRTPLSGDRHTAADFTAAARERVVLAPQAAEPWTAPHFVWAARAELTERLCGADTSTCPTLERGGFRITTTLDLRLQAIAEKWVMASAIVPHAEDPEAAAAALGIEYAKWIANLVDKDLHNGALVALDYETGQLVAYVGSADYGSSLASPQFQPQFDVIGNGWRQPGSAFKPFNYLTGIDDRKMTAASMLLDVGTDFGGGYTPSNADNLERGPVRVRTALQFSLNIPAVKAMAVNQPDHVFSRSKDFGMTFRSTNTNAGLALALGVQEVRPVDLVTAYGTLANGGRRIDHTTLLRVQDRAGADVLPQFTTPPGERVASPEAAGIVTDILAGNTDRRINPIWGRFALTDAKVRRPATLKTGTSNDAKDLNAYGFIAPPQGEGRALGEYALAVGVWNGNSDNSVVSTPEHPLFSIDVSTHVWQSFLNEATAGWAVNEFIRPPGLSAVRVDPWTGLLPGPDGPSITELFIPGTEPTLSIGIDGGVCGAAILSATGFESQFSNWLAADLAWIERAKQGPGVRGGPERTKTAYFFNNSYAPYGRTWGPLLGAAPCQEPLPSCFDVPTPDPSGIVPSFELPSLDPAASPIPPCTTPEPSVEPSPSAEPSPEPSPTDPPLATPAPSVPLPTLPPLPSIPPPSAAPSATTSPPPAP
ncbi:MAG: transglycosylase domain-containing protein [Chloroflexota bacterium]